jgi:hypothetical protein
VLTAIIPSVPRRAQSAPASYTLNRNVITSPSWTP